MAAAAPAAPASAELQGPVEFKPANPTQARGIPSFPVVVSGSAVPLASANKINAAFRHDEDLVRGAAAECRRAAQNSTANPAPVDAWTRTVQVTMRGPRYLSVLVLDSNECGGAYPNSGLAMPLVYDLASGAPVNWIKLLPLGATATLDTSLDGNRVGLVHWRELSRRLKAASNVDCRAAVTDEDDIGFLLWLDARSAMLRAVPGTFPHAIQACAATVQVKAAELRALGVSDDLVAALAEAQTEQR
jgi:hypothetical protein